MSKIRKFNNNDQDDDGGNGEDDDENYEDILIFKLIGPPTHISYFIRQAGLGQGPRDRSRLTPMSEIKLIK